MKSNCENFIATIAMIYCLIIAFGLGVLCGNLIQRIRNGRGNKK